MVCLLLNGHVWHEVVGFDRTHGVRGWVGGGDLVLVCRVRGVWSWAWVDFRPLARTLPSGPFFCCAELEHLLSLVWVRI